MTPEEASRFDKLYHHNMSMLTLQGREIARKPLTPTAVLSVVSVSILIDVRIG